LVNADLNIATNHLVPHRARVDYFVSTKRVSRKSSTAHRWMSALSCPTPPRAPGSATTFNTIML